MEPFCRKGTSSSRARSGIRRLPATFIWAFMDPGAASKPA